MLRDVLVLLLVSLTFRFAADQTLCQGLNIQVFTDKAVYELGQDTVVLSVSGENLGPGIYVDAHIALIAPDGAIYEAPDWNTDFVPLLSGFYLSQGFYWPVTEIGWYPLDGSGFPGNSPGLYQFAAVFTEPGSLEYASEIGFSPFEVIEHEPSEPQQGTLWHDGLQRAFIYFKPNVLPRTPVPMVMMLHGGGGSAAGAMNITGEGRFNELAERDEFIVVYPEGVNGHWNDCRADAPDQGASEDDVGFLIALIDYFCANHNVDPQRVYATGLSNGGFMSFRLAFELSDKVAAIASCTGALAAVSECSGSDHPISVIYMAGTADPLVPFDGGQIWVPGGANHGTVLSAEETVDLCVEVLGCDTTPSVRHVADIEPEDDSTVTVYTYQGGAEGTEVVFYEIDGGGHAWPSPTQFGPLWQSIVGKKNQDIVACDEVWEFFKRHTLDEADRTLATITPVVEGIGGRVSWHHATNRIACDLMGEDGYYDLWVMNPDGSGRVCLTDDPTLGLPQKHIGNPAWHPSGQYIVFQAQKASVPKYADNECVPGAGTLNDLFLTTANGSQFWLLYEIPFLVGKDSPGVLHSHFSHDGTKFC